MREEERSNHVERWRIQTTAVQNAILEQGRSLALIETSLQAHSCVGQCHSHEGRSALLDSSNTEPAERQGRSLFQIDQNYGPKTLSHDRNAASFLHTKHLHISWASWLTGCIWHIALTRSQSGWTFDLRIWNVRPEDSEIFRLRRVGDVRNVQRLISEGRASFLDINTSGKTLLDVSNALSEERVSLMCNRKPPEEVI